MNRIKKNDAVFYLAFAGHDTDAIFAAGIEDRFVVDAGVPIDWEALHRWITQENDWIFGWIGYDARLSLERFDGEKQESAGTPVVMLIRPAHVAYVKDKQPVIKKGSWNDQWNHWLEAKTQHADVQHDYIGVQWNAGVSAQEYMHHAADLMRQIHLGNIYEANYCIDFTAHHCLDNPEAAWKKLYQITRAPFSGYAQVANWHLLCASPERYINRNENTVISQPIKGTARRSSDAVEDGRLRNDLAYGVKERSENVMIVDLVRNDLSRIAERGSVRVEELFGVHTFNTVHHLISTVSCRVAAMTSFVDILRATFPMGSMTGAPKLSAMQWIGSHERLSRGTYSGTLGFIEPGGNFDFNVVIRSVLYNSDKHELTCNVGGAITALSDLSAEYDECLLKASAVLSAFE